MTLRYTLATSQRQHIRARYRVVADGQALVGHADYEHEAFEAAGRLAHFLASTDSDTSFGEAAIFEGDRVAWTVEVQGHG